MTIITYAVVILSLRVALLFICALGFLVAGFICWHEVMFHKANGITNGMRDLGFCLGLTFLTFLIVSLANLLDLTNQHLTLFAIVNTLTVLALAGLVLAAVRLVKKMAKESGNE